MKKTHIMQGDVILKDLNNLPSVKIRKGDEVAILHEFAENTYDSGIAVVVFDGKEAITVAKTLVEEKKIELKQHQSLCPYHAKELWNMFPDSTILMRRVYTKEECDQCKEEM